jgi:hypothetical protein
LMSSPCFCFFSLMLSVVSLGQYAMFVDMRL